jgi:hypothetical protein
MKIRHFGLPVSMVLAVFTAAGMLPLAAQSQVKENPGNPLAANAGRQVTITEVMRITEEGGNFNFKSPTRVKVAPDGSIFVMDDKQFLKFDKEGKFVANLQKVGEGPGEYSFMLDYQINNDHLLIFTYMPPKLLKFNLSGGLIKETRLKGGAGFRRPLGFFSGKFYYLLTVVDFNKTKSGIRVFNQNLYVSSLKDEITDLKLNFPIRRFTVKKTHKGGVNIMMRNLDHFCFITENEHSLFVSHTARYLVKQVDLVKGKVINQFSRKYKPVPYIREKIDNTSDVFKEFKREFFSDVTGLSLYKGKLWVFTSTLDEEKGILVDIFSFDGKYLDNFYLPLPGLDRPDSMERTPFTIAGNYLYILEKDEEEVPTIVKYKLEI